MIGVEKFENFDAVFSYLLFLRPHGIGDRPLVKSPIFVERRVFHRIFVS